MLRAFIVAPALLTMACTFVNATPLNTPPVPMVPRSAESVELYTSSPPTRPHVDVALLEVVQTDGEGAAVMLKKLRERAGKMGCDAVFVSGQSEYPGANDPDLYLFDPANRKMYATCIVYSDGPAIAAAAEAEKRFKAAEGARARGHGRTDSIMLGTANSQ